MELCFGQGKRKAEILPGLTQNCALPQGSAFCFGVREVVKYKRSCLYQSARAEERPLRAAVGDLVREVDDLVNYCVCWREFQTACLPFRAVAQTAVLYNFDPTRLYLRRAY